LDRRTDEKTWAASVVISIKIFGALIEKVRFAPDSLLEESGFEPLVPLPTESPFQILCAAPSCTV
jgi:hypothetical protein